MSAPVGGAEWNVGRTEWNVHRAEWNVHARCQHPSETKSLTLGGQFSSSNCRVSYTPPNVAFSPPLYISLLEGNVLQLSVILFRFNLLSLHLGSGLFPACSQNYQAGGWSSTKMLSCMHWNVVHGRMLHRILSNSRHHEQSFWIRYSCNFSLTAVTAVSTCICTVSYPYWTFDGVQCRQKCLLGYT